MTSPVVVDAKSDSPPIALAAPPRVSWPQKGKTAETLYFKRYKMEIDLAGLSEPQLPMGYKWVPWSDSAADAHGEVLYRSFFNQVDAIVFASLGDRAGCQNLICDVANRSDFVPEATWLVASRGNCCGTVQGIQQSLGLGAIQNVGIVSEHRGRGLGALLLRKSLVGFRSIHLGRAILEVTAENHRAVKLYRRLGFRRTKTIYKVVARPMTFDSDGFLF